MTKPTLQAIAAFGAALDKARYCDTYIPAHEADPIAIGYEAMFAHETPGSAGVSAARETRRAVMDAMTCAISARDADTADLLRRALERANQRLALAIIHEAFPRRIEPRPSRLPEALCDSSPSVSPEAANDAEAVQ